MIDSVVVDIEFSPFVETGHLALRVATRGMIGYSVVYKYRETFPESEITGEYTVWHNSFNPGELETINPLTFVRDSLSSGTVFGRFKKYNGFQMSELFSTARTNLIELDGTDGFDIGLFEIPMGSLFYRGTDAQGNNAIISNKMRMLKLVSGS